MLSSRNLSTSQATLIGLIAPICWGMSVSLDRGIAEGFGLAQEQFLLYCVSTLCVLFTVELPDFKKIDKRYLFSEFRLQTFVQLLFVWRYLLPRGTPKPWRREW